MASLDELRQAAEEQGPEEAESAQDPQHDQEQESAEEPESPHYEEEEGEPEDDDQGSEFLLTVDGEEPESEQDSDEKAQQAILHKLKKERKKRQDAQSEVDKLRAENEALKSQFSSGSSPVQSTATQGTTAPKPPNLWSPEINGDEQKYAQAFQQWFQDVSGAKEQEHSAERQQKKAQERMDRIRESVATASVSFAKQHKINTDRVAGALETAVDDIDAHYGMEGTLLNLLDTIGEGSEKVGYHLGTSEAARDKLKKVLGEDRSGLKAAAYLAELKAKLKPKATKKVSSAPEPDEPLQGDGKSESAKQLQSRYDKAAKNGDLKELRRVRSKAKELGVDLE